MISVMDSASGRGKHLHVLYSKPRKLICGSVFYFGDNRSKQFNKGFQVFYINKTGLAPRNKTQVGLGGVSPVALEEENSEIPLLTLD